MRPDHAVRGRLGFTLVELLVAAAAGGLVLAAAFGLLAAHARLTRAHVGGLAFAETARVVALVVPAEVRLAAPADIPDASADTIAIRAARGLGLACALEGATVHVRYRGMRDPDAAKDSVLVLAGGALAETAVALESDRPAPEAACAADPSARIRTWTLSDAVGGPGTPLLLYERGSYHLADRALRYRRGSGGRQPLTDERLGPGGAFSLAGAPPALAVDLRAVTEQGGEPLRLRTRARLWNWR